MELVLLELQLRKAVELVIMWAGSVPDSGSRASAGILRSALPHRMEQMSSSSLAATSNRLSISLFELPSNMALVDTTSWAEHMQDRRQAVTRFRYVLCAKLPIADSDHGQSSSWTASDLSGLFIFFNNSSEDVHAILLAPRSAVTHILHRTCIRLRSV